MKQNDFWRKVRKVLINKYAITLYVFAVLFIFVGEQSLINQIIRKREIRDVKSEIEDIKIQTKKSENLLHSLDNKDSLERFAREQYKMHTEDETIYMID
jgi:cell division protein FtsB